MIRVVINQVFFQKRRNNLNVWLLNIYTHDYKDAAVVKVANAKLNMPVKNTHTR